MRKLRLTFILAVSSFFVSSVGWAKKVDAKASPRKPASVHTEEVFDNCTFGSVNHALHEGGFVGYPQFDVMRDDGLEKQRSFSFYDKKGGDAKKYDNVLKQVIFTSWFYVGEQPQEFGFGSLFRTLNTGDRMSFIIYEKQEDTSNHGCQDKPLEKKFFYSPKAKPDEARAKLNTNTPPPAGMLDRPADGKDFFEACTRDSLNKALEYIGHYKDFINRSVNFASPQFKLLNAYRIRGSGNGDQTIFYNMYVTTTVAGLGSVGKTFDFKFETQSQDQNCVISSSEVRDTWTNF